MFQCLGLFLPCFPFSPSPSSLALMSFCILYKQDQKLLLPPPPTSRNICYGRKCVLRRNAALLESYYPAETGAEDVGERGGDTHDTRYMNFKVSPITTLFKGLVVSGIILKKNVMSDKMLIFSCGINEKLALGYFPISEGSRCRKSLGSRSLKFHQHSWVT